MYNEGMSSKKNLFGSLHLMRNNRLPLVVTIMAVIPFVGMSLALAAGSFNDMRTATTILITYAAVVISFMGGIHWGIALNQYSKNFRIANMLIIESVFPVIMAWGLVFLPEIHIQILMLTILFTFMWAIDSLLYNLNIIPQWFFTIRCIVTPVMLGSLYIVYFGIL